LAGIVPTPSTSSPAAIFNTALVPVRSLFHVLEIKSAIIVGAKNAFVVMTALDDVLRLTGY
jgi:hypothetical protein